MAARTRPRIERTFGACCTFGGAATCRSPAVSDRTLRHRLCRSALVLLRQPDQRCSRRKHYPLMSLRSSQLYRTRDHGKRAALFLWATCPASAICNRPHRGVGPALSRRCLRLGKDEQAWRASSAGQGVPPTFTKPTTELLLVATTMPTGRPFPDFRSRAVAGRAAAPRRS